MFTAPGNEVSIKEERETRCVKCCIVENSKRIFKSKYLFIVVSYNTLYLHGISSNVSSFISNCIDLSPLLFS